MIHKIKKSWILITMISGSLLMLLALYLYKLPSETIDDTPSAPVFEIKNMDDFEEFTNQVNSGSAFAGWEVHLCTDLDFSDQETFRSVGLSGDQLLAFAGILDGQGHTIRGIVNENPDGAAGIFVNLTGTVKNLRLEDCTFVGSLCGSIAAQATREAAVLNCQLKNVSTGDDTSLIAQKFSGNIWNCVAESSTLTLELDKGTIEHCYYADSSDSYILIQSDTAEKTILDAANVCDALNQNLFNVSGYYSDMNLCRWDETDDPTLTGDIADLLTELSGSLEINHQTMTINGYYSYYEQSWVFALPAGYQNAPMDITAKTSLGGSYSLSRSSGEEAGSFTWSDTTYPISFLSADNVDSLYINLRADRTLSYVHTHKFDEIPAVLTVLSTDGTTQTHALKGFYGHGNDSWLSSKKGYNLKFENITDLLGMGANDGYTLLAGYRDNSLMHFCVTTEMINALKFDHAPQYRLVNLYVNGSYLGVYFLAEKVELDQNRIDIVNVYEETKKVNDHQLESYPMNSWKDDDTFAERYWYDIPQNPEDITGGYLLEADIMDFAPDESRFVSERKIPFTMKRARQTSKEQIDYIATFWQEFENALFSENGYNELGKHYSEYIDVENFAKQWLIYELVQEESMSSSIYFYKESDVTGDGLLHACFPWDMEHSYIISYPERLTEMWNLTEKADTLYGYWTIWFEHEDFLEELSRVWEEHFLPVLDFMLDETPADGKIHNIRYLENYIPQLSRLERSRWRKTSPLSKCSVIREFLDIRIDVLNKEFLE